MTFPRLNRNCWEDPLAYRTGLEFSPHLLDQLLFKLLLLLRHESFELCRLVGSLEAFTMRMAEYLDELLSRKDKFATILSHRE